jgi:hypothetical protein
MAETGVTTGNAAGVNRSKRATHWRAAKVMSWEERALLPELIVHKVLQNVSARTHMDQSGQIELPLLTKRILAAIGSCMFRRSSSHHRKTVATSSNFKVA